MSAYNSHDGGMFIVRACSTNCIESNYATVNSEPVYSYCCSKDACNHSNTQFSNLSLIFVSMLIYVFIFFRFSSNIFNFMCV